MAWEGSRRWPKQQDLHPPGRPERKEKSNSHTLTSLGSSSPLVTNSQPFILALSQGNHPFLHIETSLWFTPQVFTLSQGGVHSESGGLMNSYGSVIGKQGLIFCPSLQWSFNLKEQHMSSKITTPLKRTSTCTCFSLSFPFSLPHLLPHHKSQGDQGLRVDSLRPINKNGAYNLYVRLTWGVFKS